MKMNTGCKFLALAAMLFTLVIPACQGGGSVAIQVSDITGPGSLDERSVADYSVTATDSRVVTYMWAVDPPSAGSFTNGTMEVATFHANEVTSDTDASIMVSVGSPYITPQVTSRDVTIIDTNQMPRASASADETEIGHGQTVQFHNESTDPEGDDDIVKCEWDFSYDEDDGFTCDCEENDPRQQFDDPGVYSVQMRVTDTSSITDMLSTPLTITVVENYAPVITEVRHSRTTSEAGNDNEAVDLQVDFSDPAPADDVFNVTWMSDHGSFDDFTDPSPTWYPPDYPVDCDITVQVTDKFGLTASGTCRQWVTGLPVLNNASAPGNVIPSQNLIDAFGGTVDPASFMYPSTADDGTVVFLSYWASFSGASTGGIPILQAVYDYYSDDAYVHIMVNEGESAFDVSSFVNDNLYEASYWALDEDASYFSMTNGWVGGASTLPQSMLFDRDGRCRWSYNGPVTFTVDLYLAIDELL